MPVEAKPLFRPDVLRPYVDAFTLPPHVEQFRPKLEHWAELIRTERIDAFRESEILPSFLHDFFETLLGYAGPASGGNRYTISVERHVEVDGKYADAVLGDFNGAHRFMVAVEGKGPRDPLDRAYAGRRMSAVDQGYRYAINLPCDWIIVTSTRETRLYHKGSDQHTYERFDTYRLYDDEPTLRRFVFLLGAGRVVPFDGRCHLYDLLAESEKVGRQVTKDYYVQYADMRQDAFEQLSRDNPEIPRPELLASTQKLLDRVLFVAFAEDRGLLPADTIDKAFKHRDPYNPKPIWDNFSGLFRHINGGNAALGIHAYNGGLFRGDDVLDNLKVSDEVCEYFHDLGKYDYRPAQRAVASADDRGQLIDVDILGHIFEQSITDLEKLKNELEGLVEPVGAEKHKTRRKKEGAFYTPSFITRYIIEQALGGVVRERFEHLRASMQSSLRGAAKAALDDPAVYELDTLAKGPRATLVKFWEAWQDELATLRILDPACGSGAFLVEAFDQLHAIYQHSNDRLHELRGHRSLFDLDKRILENNLYGVDLNDEAIEICRLSLWIKTAERGKALTSLDHSIRVGNSVVDDPDVHPKALNWKQAFPEVFKQGGFDVVVGNPPYVRQEWLSDYKSYLQSVYKAYHGMADLYVYFYELGLNVLKPGGLLSFIVTNKWMKSGYGEPLRRLFSEQAWVESVVDFGHAKQIFEDADVFPSIIVARKPTRGAKPTMARLCSIPREQLRVEDLSRQIESEGVALPLAQLQPTGWQLEPSGVNELLQKIKANGVPLKIFCGTRPFRGVTTGLNEAFLIDEATRTKLIDQDPTSAEVLRPYLRGQDLTRWAPDWVGLWMIFARRGIDIDRYPAIKAHLAQFKTKLEPRPKDWKGKDWPGRRPGTYAWYELQDPVEYWEEFLKPKIIFPEITWRAQWSIDRNGMFSNNTVYFVPRDDAWVLAVANSPVCWWYSWRTAMHGKDEALRFIGDFVQEHPIPQPSDEQREKATTIVERLFAVSKNEHAIRKTVLDWLCVEHQIEKASLKLQALFNLDSDAFVAEVKRVRGKKNPLSVAALKSLRDEHARTIEPARAQAAEALTLERQLSDLVNAAYGLTPDEVALIWQTAPPRMPFTP